LPLLDETFNKKLLGVINLEERFGLARAEERRFLFKCFLMMINKGNMHHTPKSNVLHRSRHQLKTSDAKKRSFYLK